MTRYAAPNVHPVGDSRGRCSPAARHGLGIRHESTTNSGATQLAGEFAAADPAHRARLGRRLKLDARSRPAVLPCGAPFGHELVRPPLSAGSLQVVGPSNGPYGGYATRCNKVSHHSVRHPRSSFSVWSPRFRHLDSSILPRAPRTGCNPISFLSFITPGVQTSPVPTERGATPS